MLKSFFSSDKDASYRVFLGKLFILLIFILGLWFAYSIVHVIAAFCFAGFLVMLFSPFLNWCNRHHIADWLGIVIIYLILLGLIFLIFISVIPIFVDQTVAIFNGISDWLISLENAYKTGGVAAFGLPHFLSDVVGKLDWNDFFIFVRGNLGSLSSIITINLRNLASGGAGVLWTVGSVMFSIITTFVFAFFMVLERKHVKKFFYDILPIKISEYIKNREDDIMQTLASWLRGQVILSISMFLLVYAGLWILHAFGVGLEHKATLALLAGLLESVPYFGPFLALLPALALAGSISWIAVVAVFILYIVLQQIEGQVLVPIVMSKSLDISPLFVLIMMAIGASIAGVLGILLAVPAAALIEIGVNDYLVHKKKQKM